MKSAQAKFHAKDCAATEIGVVADWLIRSGDIGRVAAVFERSFYAKLDSGWICIGSGEIGSGPLNILCDYRWRKPTLNQRVSVGKSELRVAGELFARLSGAPLWVPDPVSRWSESSLRGGLRAVDDFWQGELIHGGLAVAGCETLPARTSPLVEAAKPGLAALKYCIDDASVSAGTCRLPVLIGLGPGLTPSGDDLIGGALITLAALGRRACRDSLWDHCLPWLARTNDISQMHMKAAARGYGAAVLHTAIHVTMSGDVAQIDTALSELRKIGHTSGLDAFAGSLIVLRHAIAGS